MTKTTKAKALPMTAAMVIKSVQVTEAGGITQISGQRLGAAITKEIGNKAGRMDAFIHGLAVATIHRSMPLTEGGHLDCSYATKLVAALGKSVRAKALITWYAAFSNIRFVKCDTTGAMTAKLIPPTQAKMYKDADPHAAMLNPFWNVAEIAPKVTDYTDASLDADLKRVLARIEAASKAGHCTLSDKGKQRAANLLALPTLTAKGVTAFTPAPALDPLTVD